MTTGFGDCTNEFMEALRARSIAEQKLNEWRKANINVLHYRNNSTATIQLKFDPKNLQCLKVIPKELETPDPESFMRVSRATIETAVAVNIKENPVKKILLEVDVFTGHATLTVE